VTTIDGWVPLLRRLLLEVRQAGFHEDLASRARA
jgi:hypothetical protein